MIVLDVFGGEAPLYPKEALMPPYASFARGCKFDSGELRGFGAPVRRGSHVVPALTESMSLYKPASYEYLLTFPHRTDVIHNAHAGDRFKRVYWFSSSHPPRYADSTTALSGTGPYPGAYYTLGIPAPTAQPVVEVIGAVDGEGVLIDHVALGHDPIYRSYSYTYSSDFGEESGPWLPSGGGAVPLHKMYVGDKVRISNMQVLPGNYPVSQGKINVYQTDLSAGFLKVAVVPSHQQTVEFVNTDVSGPILRTALTMPPVAGMKGACLTSYGYMVGFEGNTLYCSDVFLYHSWPSSYAKPCRHNILRVFPCPQGAYVLTDGGSYILMGTDPSNTQLVIVESDEVCTSPTACCDLGGAVAFVSSNGLCMLSESGVSLLTSAIFDHLSWGLLSLQQSRLTRHMGRIILSNGTERYVFTSGDPVSQWVRLDVPMRVSITDSDGGEALYAAEGDTNLYAFDSDSNFSLPYSWHSSNIVLDSPRPYSCFRLFARDYFDLSIKLEVDGVVVMDWFQIPLDVSRNGYVYGRVKPYRNSRTFVIKVKGTSKLMSIVLASSFEAMRNEQSS